ncbi:ribosome maturation factor RimM [Mesorhizobium sp. NBSH29]|uniref:ribosome maturation factor RimM n=1 Tax=Mesorhizobium sp. NBSH29 TaxID=2654249 RepID=UPI0018965F2D|nr:ribosome maturation factor RimM [Mesorhizobium sp. NBSH29]QPC86036.1 ribosome maturation factor RimM [Mesorhizobium sp. NBSH29]
MEQKNNKLQNPVQMAIIGAAHGIKGELRVKAFTADPLALGDYGPLYTRDGRAFEIAAIRPQKDVVVVRFKNVSDRNLAETLTGTELFIDRSSLPEAEDEEEFYHADLVGLEVRDDLGGIIGKVQSVQNFGGGDILEVAVARGPTLMIPFTRAAIPEVAINAGYLRVEPAAAGLLDSPDDDDMPENQEEEGRV